MFTSLQNRPIKIRSKTEASQNIINGGKDEEAAAAIKGGGTKAPAKNQTAGRRGGLGVCIDRHSGYN